jgi:transketolase
MAEATAVATREAYRDALVPLMQVEERLVCIDTDSGLFKDVDFGVAAERFLNIGIAEANLMGMAAGLAASGWMPFVNTMAGFAATRALEAVKVDIAYNALPVRIAATHSGLSAGHFGPTHHSLEDLAVMRTLPNMTVLVPADAAQTASLVSQSLGLPGPVYLRLGRKATPPVEAEPPVVGRLQWLRAGVDAVLVAAGPLPVAAALEAADELGVEGVSAAVLNAHTIKPFDAETLVEAVAETAVVVTVEDHWRTGGLGATVAETLAELAPRRVLRIGVPDTFATMVGGHEFLLDHYGVHAKAVTDCVLRQLGGARIRPLRRDRAHEEQRRTERDLDLPRVRP